MELQLEGGIDFPSFKLSGTWYLVGAGFTRRDPDDPFDPVLGFTFVDPSDAGSPKALSRPGTTGWLPLAPLGSAWERGGMVGDMPGLQVARIQIDTAAAPTESLPSLGALGKATPALLGGPDWLACVPGPFLRIKAAGDAAELLLPAAAVFGFYVGTSTRLAQAALNGTMDLDPGQLIIGERTGWTGPGTFQVSLASGCGLDDALVLARSLACGPASPERWAFRLPFLGLASDTAAGRRPMIRAAFPFSGPTTLRVLGHQLRAPRAGGPLRFLGLRIMSCTAALPYKTLVVEHEGEASRARGGKQTVCHVPLPSEPRMVPPTQRPDGRIPPVARLLPGVRRRFLGYQGVGVEWKPRPAGERQVARHASLTEPMQDLATGPASRDGTGVRRLRAMTRPEGPAELPSGYEPSPEAKGFAGILDALASDFGAVVAPFAPWPPRASVGGYVFGALPPPPLFSLGWEMPNGRPRLLLAAFLDIGGREGLLVDLEPGFPASRHPTSMLVARHGDGRSTTEDDAIGIAKVARRFRRLWGFGTRDRRLAKALEGLAPTLAYHGLCHTRRGAPGYARAVAALLEASGEGRTA